MMEQMYIGVIELSKSYTPDRHGRIYPGGMPVIRSLRKAAWYERIWFSLKSRLGLGGPACSLDSRWGLPPAGVPAGREVVIYAEADVLDSLYGITCSGVSMKASGGTEVCERRDCSI